MLTLNSKRKNTKGVGAHPHKGFETVTIAYKGKIEHRDSQGNHGVIGEGDVQWMTAGKGIMHEEFHEASFAKTGGLFQMVQLWVNLPAKDKLTKPAYQDLRYVDMPKVNIGDNGSFIQVIAGSYDGHNGAATTFSPMHVYNAYLQQGDSTDMSLPADYNTALLIIDGSVKVNGDTTIQKGQFVLFENDGNSQIKLEALKENTKVLVLSGAPLNEPIARYGPFLMNTEAQIQEAIQEFQSGKFGQI